MLQSLLKKIRKKQAPRLTIVLGSGYHKNYLECTSVITDWCLLLKQLDPKIKTSTNYLLDFERMILHHKGALSLQQAHIRERSLLNKAKDVILKEETTVLSEAHELYKTQCFNPKYVSDIVSLNFDRIAEKQVVKAFQLNKIKHPSSRISKSKSGQKHIQVCNEYQTADNITVRFWYPHGNVARASSLILGARKYGMHIDTVEHFRRYSKIKNGSTGKELINSWYEALTRKPVLILGASLSSMEWDIWSAFVNRERNYAKAKNEKYRYPIYQMQNKNCVSDSHDSAFIWFDPLFDPNLNFAKQWDKLESLMSK
jgi:hypothetical protein